MGYGESEENKCVQQNAQKQHDAAGLREWLGLSVLSLSTLLLALDSGIALGTPTPGSGFAA